jgi:hypothetical protein
MSLKSVLIVFSFLCLNLLRYLLSWRFWLEVYIHFSVCNCSHPSVTCSCLGSNILLHTLFLNSLNADVSYDIPILFYDELPTSHRHISSFVFKPKFFCFVAIIEIHQTFAFVTNWNTVDVWWGQKFKNLPLYFFSVTSSSSLGQWKRRGRGILCHK